MNERTAPSKIAGDGPQGDQDCMRPGLGRGKPLMCHRQGLPHPTGGSTSPTPPIGPAQGAHAPSLPTLAFAVSPIRLPPRKQEAAQAPVMLAGRPSVLRFERRQKRAKGRRSRCVHIAMVAAGHLPRTCPGSDPAWLARGRIGN
eukprot:scaffold7662_cov255-Prasinococcus_capsulatus_cf.AAC.1